MFAAQIWHPSSYWITRFNWMYTITDTSYSVTGNVADMCMHGGSDGCIHELILWSSVVMALPGCISDPLPLLQSFLVAAGGSRTLTFVEQWHYHAKL